MVSLRLRKETAMKRQRLAMTCAGLSLIFTAQAQAASDPKVWAAAQAARPGEIALLQQIVDIDSGTGDAIGANKIQAILGERLKALGANLNVTPPEAAGLGDNQVANLTGTGKTRILIIAHIDTVFGPGTVAKRPFRIEGTQARGPGVSDEKGGVVEAVTALTLLNQLGFHDYGKITLLLETSEEMGSPGTRRLIEKLVRENDVELNMEPGDPPDALTVWRKGSETITITVHGKAAHAGINPQDGINAATELMHQLAVVNQFPQSGPGVTVNLTTLKAGTRSNIIPDFAEAEVNVRVRKAAQVDVINAAFAAQAKTRLVPGAEVSVAWSPAYPPLADNDATVALAKRAEAIYADLGLTLTEAGNGGASESAMAAAAGTPALDGLGPVGGGFHADTEYLDLTTLTPRLYMFTKLLMQLSHQQPSH
jgi:glutamate carboxypeptidase